MNELIGMGVALVTPFNIDGTVDYKSLRGITKAGHLGTNHEHQNCKLVQQRPISRNKITLVDLVTKHLPMAYEIINNMSVSITGMRNQK